MLVFAGYLMYQSQLRLSDPAATSPSAAIVSGEADSAGDGAAPAAKATRGEPVAASQPGEDPSSVSSATSRTIPGAAGDAAGSALSAPTPHEISPVVHTLENSDIIAQISNGPAMIEGWELVHYDERLPGGAVPIDLVDPQLPILSTGWAGSWAASPTCVSRSCAPVRARSPSAPRTSPAASPVRFASMRRAMASTSSSPSRAGSPRRSTPASSSAGRRARRPDADFREISLLAYGAESGVTRSVVPAVGKRRFPRIRWLQGWQAADRRGRPVGGLRRGVLHGRRDGSRVARPTFRSCSRPWSRPSRRARGFVAPECIRRAPAARSQESLRGFFGPKDPESLEKVAASLAHSVNRGWSWLEPLTRFFEMALDWLYRFIPNYGLAIILLTILVRIVTAPLMMRQMRSAERMRAVQPRMKALQERYKDDRQRQSEELMKLYREEGINPLGGCLPLLAAVSGAGGALLCAAQLDRSTPRAFRLLDRRSEPAGLVIHAARRRFPDPAAAAPDGRQHVRAAEDDARRPAWIRPRRA